MSHIAANGDDKRHSAPRRTGLYMIATDTHRDEKVPTDVTKKEESSPGCAQKRPQSSADEEAYLVLNNNAAEYHSSVAQPSTEGKEEDSSSVLVDNDRVVPVTVGEGAPSTSKNVARSKQRIRVVVRIRPIHHGAARTTMLPPDGKTLCLHTTPAKGAKEPLDQGRLREGRKELRATFDRVLGEESRQEEVYEQVRPCVRFPFQGVNACVFAYGQTGSGKTFTMVGGESRRGLAFTGPPNTTSLTNASSGGIDDPRKEQPVARERTSSGVGIHRAPCNSATSVGEAGEISMPVAIDERGGGGVIPRAVNDIFKFLREELGKSAADCRGKRLVPRQCSKYIDKVDKRASTAACSSGTCTSGSDCTNRSHSTTSNSRDCSYSEDFETEEYPSATRWPWKTPSGSVNDQQESPRIGELVLPSSRSAGDSRTLRKEGGTRRHETDTRSAAQSATLCTVECSYMQVYNGLVYDLLPRDNSTNRRPLPTMADLLTNRRDTSGIHRPAATVSESAGGGTQEVEAEQAQDVESEPARERETRRGTTGRVCSRGGDISVVGMSLHTVDTAEQAMELLRRGSRNRRVRSTQMNTNSSRSHSIVQFTITSTRRVSTAATSRVPTDSNEASEATNPDGDNGHNVAFPGSAAGGTGGRVSGACGRLDEDAVTTRAKLTLVDLAGSEKGGGGGGGEGRLTLNEDEEQERERLRINTSLSALSNCISGLGEESRTHVPFRDNVLTRLLQDSLVGGKTIVIATINPSIDAKVESISTLNFAARCMRVSVRPRVNEVASDALLLQRAKREIFMLRRRLREIETTACPRRKRSDMAVLPQPGTGGLPPEVIESSGVVDHSRGLLDAEEADGSPVSAWRQVGLVDDSRCPTRILRSKEVQGQRRLSSDRLSSDSVASESKYWGNIRQDSGREDRGTAAVETGARQRQLRRLGTTESSSEGKGMGRTARGKSCGRDTLGLAAPPSATSSVHHRRASEGTVRIPVVVSASLWKKRNVLSPLASAGQGLVSSRRRQRMGITVAGSDDHGHLATVALMERFSCREGELLRELETWKKRCEKLGDIASRRDIAFDAVGSSANDAAYIWQNKRMQPGNDERTTKQKGFSGTSASSAPSPPRSLPSSEHRTAAMSDIPGKQDSSSDSPTMISSDTSTLQSNVQHIEIYKGDRQVASGKQSSGLGVADMSRTGRDRDAWVSVLFDLIGEREDDLELKRGDIVQVLRRRQDGWWYGRSNSTGMAGLFPSNYVETLVDTGQLWGIGTSLEDVRISRSNQNGSLPVLDGDDEVDTNASLDGDDILSPGQGRGRGGAGRSVSNRSCDDVRSPEEVRVRKRVKIDCRQGGGGSPVGTCCGCSPPRTEIGGGFQGDGEDAKPPRTGISIPEPPPACIQYEGSATEHDHIEVQNQHERASFVDLRRPDESSADSDGGKSMTEQITYVGPPTQARRERGVLKETRQGQAVGRHRPGSIAIRHPAPSPESTNNDILLSGARFKEADRVVGGGKQDECLQQGLSDIILCNTDIRVMATGDGLSTASWEAPGSKHPARRAPVTAGINDGGTVNSLPLTKLSPIYTDDKMALPVTDTNLVAKRWMDVVNIGQQHPRRTLVDDAGGEGGEPRSTCKQHLLVNCILCQMRQGCGSTGYDADRSALPSGAGRRHRSGGAGSISYDTARLHMPVTTTSVSAAPAPLSVTGATPLTLSDIPGHPNDIHGCCDSHGLPGCLLCADRGASNHTMVPGSDSHSFMDSPCSGGVAEPQSPFMATSASRGVKHRTHAGLVRSRAQAIESSLRGNDTSGSASDTKRSTDETWQLLPGPGLSSLFKYHRFEGNW